MSRYISVEVEVDINEFSDEDIEKEARERGLTSGEHVGDSITEMFYAFKLGKETEAIEIAKKIAQDHTGKIL